MDDVLEYFSTKNITESSKKLYIRNLLTLNGGIEFKNLNFLKNEEAILEKIAKYKPNTRRTYIISIVSLLKGLSTTEPKKYKKLYDKYYAILDVYNKELKTNNEKSEKETANWISQDEVIKKWEELHAILATLTTKKINEEQYSELQRLVVLSLYALLPPRRNADYQNMYVYNKMPRAKVLDIAGNFVDVPPAHNILDMKDNKFIFTNFKTSKAYPRQEVTIPETLRNIINVFLKYHPLYKKTGNEVPFLCTYTGLPYSNANDITRILYKVFGKKIGCSMLRKIYLTNKYADSVKEMANDATAMGTSPSTIESQYVKN